MRRYETIAILDPDISDEQRNPVLVRIKELTEQMGGFLVEVDEWGTRKLAYAIKKKERGYYIRFDLCGNGELIDEIERFFRIDDRILKYITIVTNKDIDLENLKKEIALAEAEKEKAAQAAEAKAQAETDPTPSESSEPEVPEKETTEPEGDNAQGQEDN